MYLLLLSRDPAVLHQRVVSMVRLLGPRHWASWRLLLLGVELHCGALEEATLRAQVRRPCGSGGICGMNGVQGYVCVGSCCGGTEFLIDMRAGRIALRGGKPEGTGD